MDFPGRAPAEGGRSRLLDFLGGRYIVADGPLRASGLRLLARMRHGLLYENTRAMPEFTIVPAYRVVPRDASVYRTLASDAFDFRSRVLLYQDPFPSTTGARDRSRPACTRPRTGRTGPPSR